MNREEQIIKNLGLVHSCCKKFTGKGIDYDDLFQAGTVGLIKAVDNFDASKGLKLSTYAVPVILGEIKRMFRDGGSVKVSRSLKELSLKATRVKSELSKKSGAEPTISQIAEALDVPTEKLTEAMCATQPTLSIFQENESGLKQIDLPVQSHEDNIINIVGMRQMLGNLCEEDRKIIDLRYYKLYTQQKTAEALGMSQVQVSRKEKAILFNLREMLK